MDFLNQNGGQTKVKVGPNQQSVTKDISLNVGYFYFYMSVRNTQHYLYLKFRTDNTTRPFLIELCLLLHQV